MKLCENDFAFGPGADCRGLDFTIRFSNIFLTLVPSLVLLALSAPRLSNLIPKQRKLLPLEEIPTGGLILLGVKALSAICLVGADIAVCITWEKTPALQGEWSGWAAGISSVLSAVVLAAMVLGEHLLSYRHSQLPALYLLINLLFTAQRLRTLALLSLAPTGPLIASLVLASTLFTTLQISNRSSIKDGSSLPPSATAGLVSRYLVSWVMPLLWRGYSQPLDMEHLGSIDTSLHSINTWQAFAPAWSKQRSRYDSGKTRQPLLWSCMTAFPTQLAAPLLPCLIYAVASLARPLIILQTVNFVTSYSTSSPKPLAEGWGLVAAAFLSYAVYALARALGHVALQRSALALRGALMEALYRKTLVMKVETAREMGASRASNLMSVDVGLIVQNVESIHESWTALVMTGLGLYIIWTQIGLSFLASVIGAVAFFAILPMLTRNVGSARGSWAESTDHRVKFMASVFRHIKAVKLSAYEPTIHARACLLRETEISRVIGWVKEVLKVSIATNWLGNFLSLVTIIVYTVVSIYSENGGSAVNTAKIFTITSTITLISSPLLMLGQRMGNIISAWSSVKRIEEFLLMDEKSVAAIPAHTGGDVPREIVLNQASYGIKGKKTLLSDLNVDMIKPRLWMLAGTVGSGKSTFLHALLGDVDLLSGTSKVNLGTIGFCSQDPWLRTNCSIKENIVFMHRYEAEWYWTVVKAVGLDVDLAVITHGDECMAGNLSGGQKQRVALARALYGRFDTYILDDVFSALDVDTESKVFKSLFEDDGLLADKCVIMSTNQIHRLSHASSVTILADGRIIEQGTYSHLYDIEEGAMRSLVREFTAGDKGKTKEQQVDTTRELADGTDSDDTASRHSQKEGRKGNVAWSTYMLYLRSMGRTNSTIWLVVTVIVASVETCINVYLQAWTSTLAGSSRSRYAEFLGGYAGLQVGLLFAFAGAMYNAFMVAHPQASRRLHNWMLSGLLGTSLAYFESNPAGQMVNRFNSDLNIIDMQLPNAALNFMFDITQIFGGMILIVVAAPYMAAVLVGVLVIMFCLQRFYVRAARELRRLDLTSKSPIYTLFSETVDPDGLRTLRAMRAEESCLQHMTNAITASQHPTWLLKAVQKWLELALNLCVSIVNTILITIAVVNRHSVSAGILAAALSSAATLNESLGRSVVQWTEVEMSITSVERVQEYIDLPSQESAHDSPRVHGKDESWNPSGGIRFSHVTARYQPNLPPALQDVSFAIKPGQRVGICGRSGSGKSTLLGVLWRLIDCDSGDGRGIFMDGEDISDVGLSEYRRALSIVPQDPMLLELSLRDNLDPEGLCQDADIWSALESSQLRSYVESLPNKLDEMIKGDGALFSRGQRQLLALARAILRQRRILALDEATSSIDARTDLAIQQTIRDAFTDCTVLTVAHRISTIIDYDVIVVMEAGSVVEIGSPESLLTQRNGRFRQLALESGLVSPL